MQHKYKTHNTGIIQKNAETIYRQFFYFERTRWKVSQKGVVHTKVDIYIFITLHQFKTQVPHTMYHYKTHDSDTVQYQYKPHNRYTNQHQYKPHNPGIIQHYYKEQSWDTIQHKYKTHNVATIQHQYKTHNVAII
jgi:hypothetical protein